MQECRNGEVRSGNEEFAFLVSSRLAILVVSLREARRTTVKRDKEFSLSPGFGRRGFPG